MRTAARRLTGTTSPIYERPFEVVYTDTLPEAKDSPRPAGGHFNGCRIGFDAGGSDRKVSAVVDGETVYSEEVVWFPKTTADPDYHYDGIVAALRTAAGIALDSSLSPAEKLKVVQKLMEEGDLRAAAIYRSIGVYLAHSLALYRDMYHFRHVLLLGRVMSGAGGELVIEECERVLRDEYSDLADCIHLALPDEKFRRVGQSAAAASLPELRK